MIDDNMYMHIELNALAGYSNTAIRSVSRMEIWPTEHYNKVTIREGK